MATDPKSKNAPPQGPPESNGSGQLPAKGKGKFTIEAPSISLPTGGGALKSIDEKFSVNASNGTASFGIPIPFSNGRNGFTPSLSLQYNSGTGNSIFGIGWDLQLPSIQRKTDKRLPEYNDADESDTFLLAGAEDLVPLLDQDPVTGDWKIRKKTIGNFFITEYRPRIEGGFARIEKIQRNNETFFYWKLTSRENIVTFFGKSPTHRIAYPGKPALIYKWLPELSFDDKGNLNCYEYKNENTQKIRWGVHEANRNDGNISNKHLKKINYANKTPFYPGYIVNKNNIQEIYDTALPAATVFLMSAILDYGEHIANLDSETVLWDRRPDPFSIYSPGFDMRTYRRCKRIMMFHNFNELGPMPTLVRSLDFAYKPSSFQADQYSEMSYLDTITHTGYKMSGGVLTSKSFPPLTFYYELLKWNKEIRTIDKQDLVHSPVGLSSGWRWIDLWGESISGILSEQADGLYYKSNLGPKPVTGKPEFTEAVKVSPKPSFNGHNNGILQITDLEANGRKQVVITSKEIKGYFEVEEEGEWTEFRSFIHMHNLDMNDPNIKLIDLNGDGRPDILISEENVFTWYPSEGKRGYKAARTTHKPFDEEKGPAILFSDMKQSIYTADMNGDGLTDIIRIRNNDISYWPNLGYGKFGAKVTMENAPCFDLADQFNPSCLQLADISGTGLTDIIYLGKNLFRAWINLGGNAWSNAEDIYPFPSVEQPSGIAVVDLLGNGTSCIVWSSPLQKHQHAPMRYIDLMGSKKPHLLCRYTNNMGKETRLTYRSSTSFYLEDNRAGKHWMTRLPFPVHCVSRVEIDERITGTKFVNEYKYHEGYYDHTEKEFRGFGMVEQFDTEDYESWKRLDAFNLTDQRLHQDPVRTVSWFHTGCFFRRDAILKHLKKQYYRNAVFAEYDMPDARIETTTINRDLSGRELREAVRCCKGMLLRKEIYALDNSGKNELPYTVEEQNCHVRILQPAEGNAFAVFLVHPSEQISYHYERNDADPRISHKLTTAVDQWGNIIQSATVVYKRQIRDLSLAQVVQDEQDRSWITFIENNYTGAIINDATRPEAYRLGQVCEIITWELRGVNKVTGQFFSVDQINALFGGSSVIPYERDFAGGMEKRKIEHIRHLFLKNDLSAPMPLYQQASLGILFQSYKLSFTNGLIHQAFVRNGIQLVTDTELTNGKYLKNILYKPAGPQPATAGLFPAGDNDDDWWAVSGTHGYPVNPAARFYMPDKYTDPFGNTTKVKFDASYQLHIVETEDATTSKTAVLLFDYRVMLPLRVKDINDNISEISVDTMGMVTGAAFFGKGGEADDFVGFSEDLTPAQISAFMNNPLTNAPVLLGNATSRFVYDFDQYLLPGPPSPVFVATISRETHFNMPGGIASKFQISFEYSDGLGNIILRKVQAEPGVALQLQATPAGLEVAEVNTGQALRWVSNSRAVKNNKGSDIRRYEPYFSVTHRYESASQLVEIGVSPLFIYDPLERLVRTELPNGTFTHAEFDVWKEKKYDTNDNVGASTWFTDRIGGAMGLKEQEAAQKTLVHDNTPSEIFLDTLGRAFYTIDLNRFRDRTNPLNIIEEEYRSFIEMDVEGNHRRVIDPRNEALMRAGNPYVAVMEYMYDMSGGRIREKSMDAGVKWVFDDCMGKALYGWDSLDHKFTTIYDVMNRPVEHKVLLPANPATGVAAHEISYDKTIYSPNTAAERVLNRNGKPIEKYDGAGQLQFERYDFKGNCLRTHRRFTRAYDQPPDWSNIAMVQFQAGQPYTVETSFDALNRTTRMRSAEQSIFRPVYNEAGLLNEVHVRIRGGAEQAFVTNIDHDAKGQRQLIEYANNTYTEYFYDPLTYRLSSVVTTRTTDNKKLQDLRYTYDPTGNITSITDAAIQTVYFNDTIIKPDNDFEYDAIYRLIKTEGREHTSAQQPPDESDVFRRNIPLPVNELAMQQYREYFDYDEVGNMLRMVHQGGRGALSLRWTKEFGYGAANNQLLSMDVAGIHHAFNYNVHGQVKNLSHLNGMDWDFEGNLQLIDKGGGGKVYYNYDAEGNRVRKVWVKPGNIVEERVYVGNAEIFTQTQAAAITLRRETVHIMDDKKRIAMVETRTDANPVDQLIRYQYNNFLGTCSLELDDKGDIISYEEYYVFGNTSFQSGRSLSEVSLKRYRYTGKERDEESGLYYQGARYYAPWLARWTAADPTGVEDGPNVFIYVRNNPVNSHDPTGLINWRMVAIVAAVVIVGVVVTAATAGAAGPIVAGAAASVFGAGTTAATVATGVVVGAAAGAAGGAASELTRQVASGEEVNGRAIGRAALVGAAGGAVTGGLGAAATAARSAGAAAAATTSAAQTATTASRAVAVARTVARGAATGAAGSAASEVTRQAVSGEGFSGERLLRAAGTGAIVGAGVSAAGVAGGAIRARIRAGGSGGANPPAPAPASSGQPASSPSSPPAGNAPAPPAAAPGPAPAAGPAAAPTAPAVTPPPGAATNWRQHEQQVEQTLRGGLPANAPVGRQVTLDVTGPGGQTTRIRIDNMYRDPATGNYQLVDAKFSSVRDLSAPGVNLTSTVTPNQQLAYGWIRGGTATSIAPAGNLGVSGGGMAISPGVPITVNPNVQIHVNGPTGITILNY